MYGTDGTVAAKFCMLRQQAEKENNDDPYLCLSDFVAPKGTGPKDYLGAFAVGMFGGEEQMEAYAKVSYVEFAGCVWQQGLRQCVCYTGL